MHNLLTGYEPSTMAEAKTVAVAVIPLKGSNYRTWKIQCKMALMREGLWDIVAQETKPSEDEAKLHTCYLSKNNGALANNCSVSSSVASLLTGRTSKTAKHNWTAVKRIFRYLK